MEEEYEKFRPTSTAKGFGYEMGVTMIREEKSCRFM